MTRWPLHGAAGSRPTRRRWRRPCGGQAEQGVQSESLDRRGGRRPPGGARAGGRLPACHPVRDATGQVIGYLHHFAMISVVARALAPPFDVEPYGPGDSEYGAGQRYWQRAVAQVGRRFADYVVADGEFATAPFLHAAAPWVARGGAAEREPADVARCAEARFTTQPPTLTLRNSGERIELWDADDSTRGKRCGGRRCGCSAIVSTTRWPWSSRPTVDGTSRRAVGSRLLYRLPRAAGRSKTRASRRKTGTVWSTPHHTQQLAGVWLLTIFALRSSGSTGCATVHLGRHRPATPSSSSACSGSVCVRPAGRHRLTRTHCAQRPDGAPADDP